MRLSLKRCISAAAVAACLGVFGVVAPTAIAAEGMVAVNATNFPDAAFRSYIEDNFDENFDGQLSSQEIAKITEISIPAAVSSIKGIELLPEVTSFAATELNGHLVEGDFTRIKKLGHLTLMFTSIKSLDLSGNNNLYFLFVDANHALTSVNLTDAQSPVPEYGEAAVLWNENALLTLKTNSPHWGDANGQTVPVAMKAANGQYVSAVPQDIGDASIVFSDKSVTYDKKTRSILTPNSHVDTTRFVTQTKMGNTIKGVINFTYLAPNPVDVDTVRVSGEAGQAPDLPSTVIVHYSDGSTRTVPVTWHSPDWSHQKPGVVTVHGDVQGTALKAIATVTLSDTTAPVFSGVKDVTLDYGAKFDSKSGVTAKDDVDGDVTASIKVTGSVDTSKAGTYTLTYTVADKAGNKATATRKVTVKAKAEEPKPNPEPEQPSKPSEPSKPSTPSVSFVDVNESTPHAEDIDWLASTGISTGWKRADGKAEFRGMNSVVRQDMAAFLYRLAGSPVFDESKAENPFVDVSRNTPHYKEILWLASTGISTGWHTVDGKREFRGNASVVRQDMAAFLKRLADYQGANPKLGAAVAFKDVTSATPHADDIGWLARTGVTTGWKDGTFRGMNPVARQDMAAFLHRMDANVLK